ncbi:MAG: TonB-dependent receptor, partial [Pseudomonadota bacterium]
DYYNIDIEDAIGGGGGLDPEVILALCVDAPSIDNIFCDAAPRDPATGLVQSVSNIAFNLAAIETEGIDYEVIYQFNLDQFTTISIGDFQARVAGTYLIDRTLFPLQSIPQASVDQQGTFAVPRTFLNFGLSWNLEKWSVDYLATYQSSQLAPGISNEEIDNDPFLNANPNTGDAFVHNIGVSYEVSERFQFFGRINDLGDRGAFDVRTTIRPATELGRNFLIGFRGTF